jgi:integrase
MSSLQARSRKRAKPGTVKIRCSNDRLQLIFSLDKKRYCLSLGLSDTPFNRKQAQDKALEIERDIQYGEFDPTLEKYRPQSVKPRVESVAEIAPSLTLLALWMRYLEYICVNASPKTINGTYEPVTAHLRQCRTDGLQDALKFRTELLKATTQDQTRRSLMQLSAACKWGMKHIAVISPARYTEDKEIYP